MSDYAGEYYEGNDRYYLNTKGVACLSVTSFLSKYEDLSSLVAWRKRLGDEAADKVSKDSADRGKLVHSYIDSYLTNRAEFNLSCIDENVKFYAETAIDEFYSKIIPISNEQVIFYNAETEDGKAIRYAGRYDHLVKIPANTFKFVKSDKFLEEGLAIVDLKTKNKPIRIDKINYILKYALQCAAYARTLENIKYLIIVTVTNKNYKIICFSNADIEFYISKLDLLLYDWYILGEKTSEDTRLQLWTQVRNLANCSYDIETGTFNNYLPKQIMLA